jgi:hypothetical protein
MKYVSLIGSVGLLATLTACSSAPSVSVDERFFSSSTSSESSSVDAREYSYQGTLTAMEASIYMEGTHQLTLPNGSFLLLRSEKADLSAYEGQEVEVTGPIANTVEGNAEIMTVTSISAVQASEGSSSYSSEEASVSEVSSTPSSTASSAKTATSSVAVSSAAKSSAVSSSDDILSAEMRAKVQKMASSKGDKQQQYCSSHIGMCFPMHASWWYKSFGATTSTLWHVELSSEEINNLGEGPIAVNLISGALSGDDQRVETEGYTVVGYRAWTGNRHFEVTAPTELRSAVEQIVKNIIPYDGATGAKTTP